MGETRSGGHLAAILLNPCIGSPFGSTSFQMVDEARQVLAFESCGIANLFSRPTRDITGITAEGSDWRLWSIARPALEEAIASADGLLIGWGLGGLGGDARINFLRQVRWTRRVMAEQGHTFYWQVGDGPRHPSRWRQYLGPTRGVTTGATRHERLSQALQVVSLETR